MEGKRINLHYNLFTYLPIFKVFDQAHEYPTTLKDHFEPYHLQKHVLPDKIFDNWKKRMEDISGKPPEEQGALKAKFDKEVQQYIYDART